MSIASRCRKSPQLNQFGLQVVAHSLGSFTRGIGLRVIDRHPPCAGTAASRHGTAGVAGSLGTARLPSWRLWARDPAIEKPKDSRLFLEPRRVRATEMVVSRCVGRRQTDRGVVAPNERDGVSSSRMDVAHYRHRPIFGSMLGLGRTAGYLSECAVDRSGRRWNGVMTPNVVSERAQRYASLAATQRFPF
jgi:hypothetical protein